MNYVELRLSVSIYDLFDDLGEDGKDCAEICELFKQLGITPLEQSLPEQFHYCYYVYANIGSNGDSIREACPGDIRAFLASSDDETFLVIDLFEEATDQMSVVEIGVRCPQARVDRVLMLFRSIRERAAVASALLQGNLGLKEELQLSKFPREVINGYETALQHLSIYQGGVLQATSRETGKGTS